MRLDNPAWLSLLLAVLSAAMLFLRHKFPDAGRRAETAVLLCATIVFFTLCGVFLR